MTTSPCPEEELGSVTTIGQYILVKVESEGAPGSWASAMGDFMAIHGSRDFPGHVSVFGFLPEEFPRISDYLAKIFGTRVTIIGSDEYTPPEVIMRTRIIFYRSDFPVERILPHIREDQ